MKIAFAGPGTEKQKPALRRSMIERVYRNSIRCEYRRSALDQGRTRNLQERQALSRVASIHACRIRFRSVRYVPN